MGICPCGSDLEYSICCEPVIRGEKNAETAEQLIKARYSAYVKAETDFLFESIHPEKREGHDDVETRKWAEKSVWHGLEIIQCEGGGKDDERGEIEFVANYSQSGKRAKHHEHATFVKSDGKWYFEDGVGVAPAQVVREGVKIGRNEPCPCNSGKKYKKCCGK